MTLKELIQKKEDLRKKIDDIWKKYNTEVEPVATNMEFIDDEINKLIKDPVSHARRSSGKEYGTIDVLVEGVMVKHNAKKKVTWDQKKLLEIKSLIESGNDDPALYMTEDIKYKVSEKDYEKFVPAVKAIFDKARTTDVSSIEISFKLREK